MYKVFFKCANILLKTAQIGPRCAFYLCGFTHFGLNFTQIVYVKSKLCTKCAVWNIGDFILVLCVFAILCK